MFVDDRFEIRRGTVAVPGAFRVDHGNRTADADAQAVCLRSEHTARHIDEPKFLEPSLEILPGFLLAFVRRAFAADAEKDVPAALAKRELARSFELKIGHCPCILPWAWRAVRSGRRAGVPRARGANAQRRHLSEERSRSRANPQSGRRSDADRSTCRHWIRSDR